MDSLLIDLRQAVQSLRRQPRFLVTAIATLAIGIGGTTAIFSVLKGVILEPLPYQESGQLVRLTTEAGNGYFTRPDFLDLREQSLAFSSLASYFDYTLEGFDLTGSETPRRVVAMPVSADYFSALGIDPILGEPFNRQDERSENRRVAISFRLWKDHFRGDPKVIGRAVRLDREPWTVSAVLPADFQEPFGRRVDLWRAEDLAPVIIERWDYYLSVMGRLRSDVSIESAQEEIDAIVARIDAENPGRDPWQIRLEPLRDSVIGKSRTLIVTLLGAVTLVLAIACVNVANLTLARNTSRERELALRSAMGGNRRRLVRQLLAESVLLGTLGGVAGLGVAWLAIEGLRALRPEALPRIDTVAMDGYVFIFAAAASILTGILFGLAPALRTSRTSLEGVLRDTSRSTTTGIHQRRLRSALVVSELSLAFILAVGAALLAQSLGHLLSVDPGFSAENVLTFQLDLPTSSFAVEDPTQRIELDRALRERLVALPGVDAAGAVSRLPLTGDYHSWGYVIRSESEAAGKPAPHLANVRVVSGDYFDALGVTLLRGRPFSGADTLDTPRVAVVNRALAERRFGDADPLGEWIGPGNEGWRQIVGVVENERIGLRNDIPERVYYPYTQWANDRAWTMTWVVKGQNGQDPQMAEIRAAVADLDPELVPFNAILLEDVVAKAVAREQFAMVLLVAFAAAALALAVVGIFGVLSYSVAQRVPEIGLRLALGAHRHHVRDAVLREALWLTAAALVLGAAGAWALTESLESLVYGVSLRDLPTFFAVAVLLLLIAILTSLIPAQRAARADSAELLRSG